VNTPMKLSALLLAALVLGGAAYMVSAAPIEENPVPQTGEGVQSARRLLASRHRLGFWFMKNGAPMEVEGKIIDHTPGITVVEVNGEYLNVLTPARWLVGDEIVSAADLFEGWLGKSANLKTLYSEKTWNVKVSAYAVYEITVDGVTARAVLGINIDNVQTP
jgi:hypothetical protein